MEARPSLPRKKTVVIGFLSLVYLAALAYLVSPADLVAVVGQIPGEALLATLGLVVLGNLLALARSAAVIDALGFRPRWGDLFLAFAAGNISNLPLNIVGQSLTRAMVLVRAGVPFGVTVTATYIERILAAGLLLVFSLVALWVLFDRIAVDIQRAGDILATLVAIVVVAATVLSTVLRSRISAGAAHIRRMLRLWPAAALTVLCHAAALAAYLALLARLHPDVVSAEIIAALVIVLFVSNLPISFAGWGLRELSAAAALGFVGISAEAAVAAALAIGLIFMATTGLFGALAFVMVASKTPRRSSSAAPAAGPATGRWDTIAIQACALLCACLVFFRMPLQLGRSEIPINVNFADVVVIVALSLIALLIASGRIRSLFPATLNTAFAGLSAVMVLGLLVSFARDNLGGWALYTRGVGWILLLGYAALGAAVVGMTGDRLLLVRSMIAAALTICAMQLGLLAWSVFVSPVPAYVLAYPLEGYANNQNAFCFELGMVGTLMVAGRRVGLFDRRDWLFAAGIVAMTLAVYFSGSRTGAVFVICLATLDALADRWLGDRPRFRVALLAAATIVAAIIFPYIVRFAAISLNYVFGADIAAEALFTALARPDEQGNTRLLHPTSDIERWETIVGGLSLWVDRPVLGAGMGAYVQWLLATGQRGQGIHSIYVWFLSEMGVVGLAALLALGTRVAFWAWRMLAVPAAAPWAFVTLGILALMAIGGLVQDFFFQRLFWFVLGFSGAMAGVAANETSDARVFLAATLTVGVIVFCLAL